MKYDVFKLGSQEYLKRQHLKEPAVEILEQKVRKNLRPVAMLNVVGINN